AIADRGRQTDDRLFGAILGPPRDVERSVDFHPLGCRPLLEPANRALIVTNGARARRRRTVHAESLRWRNGKPTHVEVGNGAEPASRGRTSAGPLATVDEQCRSGDERGEIREKEQCNTRDVVG